MYTDNFSSDSLSVSQYSVGDVAAILGVHPNTVRYFDRTGIVSPERNDLNGRRTYTPYEVYLLTLRKQYQNMVFSVAETDKIFKDYTLQEILDNFQSKYRDQKEKIAKENLILKGTERLTNSIENIPFALNRCFFAKRPKLFRHPHLKGSDFSNSENDIRARHIFIDLMPFGYYSFRLSAEKQFNSLEWDMALDPDTAKAYGFDKISGTVFEPEAACVYTIFKVNSQESVSKKHLQYVDRFIRQNNFVICGDITGNIIINVSENGKQVRYFEAWIPIEANR